MSEALVAGLLAGYGIAVPVGAIAVLIIGLTARTSLRVGAAAALGVATADGVYAALAVLGGAALADAITPYARPMRLVAAVILLGLAVRTAATALRRRDTPVAQLPVERAESVEEAGLSGGGGDSGKGAGVPGKGRAGGGGRLGRGGRGLGGRGLGWRGLGWRGLGWHGLGTPGRAFAGLLGLTLLNPTTVIYFAALVVGRRAADGSGAAADVVFVLAAFAASASWQLLLAGGGTLVGRVLAGARGRLATALISSAVIAALAVGLLLAS